MPTHDLPAYTTWLKHANATYFQHASFRNILQNVIASLHAPAHYDLNYVGIPLCTVFSMSLRYMVDHIWLIGGKK